MKGCRESGDLYIPDESGTCKSVHYVMRNADSFPFPDVIRLSGSPHTSESPPQILVLLTMHKKLRQELDNLFVRQEFNGVDYSASWCGSCNHPYHDK